MTDILSGTFVIPAKAGIQGEKHWTPAFAGVTKSRNNRGYPNT
jgi:hypothetical protein